VAHAPRQPHVPPPTAAPEAPGVPHTVDSAPTGSQSPTEQPS
jgi:hypothetical protein